MRRGFLFTRAVRTAPVRAVGVVPRGLPRRRRRRTACQGCLGLSPSRWHGPDWSGFLFALRVPGRHRWAGVRVGALAAGAAAAAHAGVWGQSPRWVRDADPCLRSIRFTHANCTNTQARARYESGTLASLLELSKCVRHTYRPAGGGGLGQPFGYPNKLLKPASRDPSAGRFVVRLDYLGCQPFVHYDGGVGYHSVLDYPFQNRHQDRAGAALRAVCAINRCNSPISPVRAASCPSRLSIRAFSSTTRVLLLVPSPVGGGAVWDSFGVAWTGLSTIHRNPPAYFSLVAEISPDFILFRTVSWATPKVRLAWAMVKAVIGWAPIAVLRSGYKLSLLYALYPGLRVAYARLGEFYKLALGGFVCVVPCGGVNPPGAGYA